MFYDIASMPFYSFKNKKEHFLSICLKLFTHNTWQMFTQDSLVPSWIWWKEGEKYVFCIQSIYP